MRHPGLRGGFRWGALGRRLLLALPVLGCLAAPSAAWASPPVTLTDANDAAHPVTYTAGPFFVPNINPPTMPGPSICDSTHPCDETQLTVSVSTAASNADRIKITMSWPNHQADSDFDLYVLQNGGVIAQSATSNDPEVTAFPAANGTYTIRVVEYDPQGQSFTINLWLEPIPASLPPPTGPAGRYQVYPGPASSGEPSIGVDWATGVVATQSDTHTLFTTFNDCSSPAADTWVQRDAPTSKVDFDPILFTDLHTGRTFASLLLTDAVLFTNGCSESSHTDDDGVTWLPNDGCGHPAGSDHQSFGGGPYHAPLVSPPAPAYPDAVYYCAQDPSNPFTSPALCARSDDGGVTFGPSVAASNFECGGIHGHVKVAPDGTVYLPQRICGASGSIGDAVVVSTDNGVTWNPRVVPNSSPSTSDPSVATGLNTVGKPPSQASNTIYLGYCEQVDTAHSLAKVAVSHDQGATWVNVFDVGASAGIQNCVFPEMAAGDDNRAALFFLGTPTAGDTQNDAFSGVWHAYVATTFDGGASWGLADATPGDPVQIGKVCLGGINCTGGRNLLDFNDATVDKQGRLVGVFADGCLPPGCTASSDPSVSRSALDTIIRQSGGKRLFAAYDPPEPAVPGAPRLVSAVRHPEGVVVDWLAPDNGGSPLTLYQIYRGTSPGQETFLTNVSADKTRLVDTSAAANTAYYYQVAAYNGLGPGGFCGELAVTGQGPVESICEFPGVTVLYDPAGDQVGGPNANKALDILSEQVAEPWNGAADQSVTFTINVADLSTVPPNGIWQVRWTANDTNGTPREFYVEANTTANPAALSGDYGWHDPGSNFDLGQCVAPCTTVTVAADQAHNRIVLHFKTGQTLGYHDVQNAHVFDAKFPAGTTLGGFNGKTQLLVGGVVGGELITVDTTTAVTYTVKGNLFCAPDTNPPVAVLKVTPASGAAPLAVTLDGSQSSDPDGVDTVASYTFDFGDGTPPVTTNAPTSSTGDTYKNGGTFHATLKVTDSRGHDSTNPAEQEVMVSGPSLGLNFFTVTPCRVLDTRVQGQGPALSSGTVREVQVGNRCGIPAAAIAVSVNLTVVGPTSGGSLIIYPNPTDTAPVASTLSFDAGQTRANNAVAALNTLSNDGTVQALATIQNGGTVDLVVDVNGYFAP